MKILVLAAPRTGSKFLTTNLVNYFGEEQVTKSYFEDLLVPATDIFAYDYSHLGYHEIGLDHNHNIIKLPHEIPLIDTFFNNRFNVISSCTKPIIIKHHYRGDWRGDNYSRLLKMIEVFDKIIILKRKNVFEQLLSAELAEILNSWHASQRQAKLIAEAKINKLNIDEEKWVQHLQAFNKTNDLQLGPAIHVTFEDALTWDCATFCQQLGLPTKDFLLNKQEIEFGNNKLAIVKNLAKICQLFAEHCPSHLNHMTHYLCQNS